MKAARRLRWWCALAGAIACAPADGAVLGGQPVSRPAAAQRVVRHFDFEERDTNPLPVPQGWYRGQEDAAIGRVRPGFPIWNQATLDYRAPAWSGEGSVRLGTEGGSTSLVVHSGVIPIFPGAEYLVAARVRTEGLNRARARVGARYLDQDGDVIPGSEVWTEPVVTHGKWTGVSIPVAGDQPQAAFLQLELQLAQASVLRPQDDPDAQQAFAIRREDIEGAAWFDDVMVVQTPRISFRTDRAGGVYHAGEQPTLQVSVHDLAGQKTALRAVVYDAMDNVVAEHVFNPRIGYTNLAWKPELPERLGWYHAVLELTAGEALVGGASTSFVWIRPPTGRSDVPGASFGFVVERSDAETVGAVRAAAKGTGVQDLTMPVWWGTDARGAGDDDLAGRAIAELLYAGGDVGLVFDRLPTDVARSLGLRPQDVVSALASGSDDVLKIVDPYMERFGQRVLRWQAGFEPDPNAGRTQRAAARTTLERLVPEPVLVTPASYEVEPPARSVGEALVTRVPAGAAPDGLREAAGAFISATGSSGDADGREGGGVRFVLEQLDPHVFGESASGADLARRALTLWEYVGGVEGVSLDLLGPFESSAGGGRVPSVGLGVWAALRERLIGRRVAMRFEPARGVTALLLAPDGSGMTTESLLAVWQSGPAAESISVMVGASDVRGEDLFGNDLALESRTDVPGAPTVVPVSTEPVFVRGVSAELLMFLASVRLDPGVIAARGSRARHEVVFDNPWPSTIRGRVLVLEPGGYLDPSGEIDRSWDIAPRILSFVVEPGEQARMGLDIGFSRGKLAGEKPFVLDIELQAPGVSGTFRHEGSVEYGLPEIEFRVASETEARRDLSVRVEVTNVSDEQLDFVLLAAAAGYPRSRLAVSDVQPGETVVRRFQFPNGLETLADDTVVVAISVPDLDGQLVQIVAPPGSEMSDR